MHAYLLKTGRLISPFGEPPGAMKVHNRTLRQTQIETLRALGCVVEEIAGREGIRRFPCLVIHDDVFFTFHGLRAFIRAVGAGSRTLLSIEGGLADARQERRNSRACLDVSVLTERFAPAFQGPLMDGPSGEPCRAYDVYHLRQHDPERSLEAQSRLVSVPYRCRVVRARVNTVFEPTGRFDVPISTVAFCPVRHWASLISANLLGLPSFLLERMSWSNWLSLPAKALWRAGSVRPDRLIGKTYLRGTGCRIHSTAHIEGAVIGRMVRIGPNAVIRGAVIGDKTEIGAGAVVEGCSLGQRVAVNSGVVLKGCVADDGASLGQSLTQFSVVGRGSVLCSFSSNIDFKLHSTVTVRDAGRIVESGSRVLGSCIGHQVFVGAGVCLASGREVPNGCILIRDPGDIVTRIDPQHPAGEILTDRGRTLIDRPHATDRWAA